MSLLRERIHLQMTEAAQRGHCLSVRSLVLYGVFSMIKKLFFMAALLAPGLAYGGNPSADLTGQIVPAGSGPPVPAPAAAAGFTTLAGNFDFSQPLYATQSNWLDCPTSSGNRMLW